MKKNIVFILIAILLVAVTATFFLNNKKQNDVKTKVRIGWQVPWAVQGQIAQSLKNNEYLANNDLDPEFTGFDSGAPLNEAALAGKVDIIFTADQPAATLLSKSDDWVIVSRLMYNRVSLYVPPKSEINKIEDLRGKTVAMPFGAAAQRMAYRAEKDAGLNPLSDVKNINLNIYEQSDLVKDANATKWGNIDALAGFDPTPAIFEDKGLTKNLKTDKVVSVVMVSKKFINDNPGAMKKFLKSYKEAYYYYAQNQKVADRWFLESSKLNISENALKISASLEPNLNAKKLNDVRLDFNEDDYRIMQEAADFIYENKLIQKAVNMRDHVDMQYLP